jgi:hypothetical protein
LSEDSTSGNFPPTDVGPLTDRSANLQARVGGTLTSAYPAWRGDRVGFLTRLGGRLLRHHHRLKVGEQVMEIGAQARLVITL